MSTLQELKDRQAKRLEKIANADKTEFETDEVDDTGTLFARWITNTTNPNESMQIRTGETLDSFLELYTLCKDALAYQRKGKKTTLNPCDSLLLLLTYYKNYQTSDELGIAANLPTTTVHETITRTATKINSVLIDNFLQFPKTQLLKAEIKDDDPFPEALAIVDSVFLPSHAPLATFPAAKTWFSH